MNATLQKPRGLLEETPMQAPIAGTIRTGIMVLTKAAAEHRDAVRIYKEGVRAGLKYDEIGRNLCRHFGDDRRRLTPRNTPYFRVAAHDFINPDHARQVFDLYAEDRGGGMGRQLYRFPVVFASDDWLQNMPHGLCAFSASELRFQSRYDAAGVRHCMMHAEAQLHEHSKRAVRRWGGRELVPRPENSGLCQPERCPEYQTKACKLSGRLLFYVPGINASALIELNTTSFYSLDQIHAVMKQVAAMRAGRISGVLNSSAIFALTKVEQEVSMLDDVGRPQKTMQHLVHLETNLPVVELMAAAERRVLAGPSAPSALAGPAAPEGYQPPSDVIEHGAPDDDPPPPDVELSPEEEVERLRARIGAIVDARGERRIEFGARMRGAHGPEAMRGLETLRKIVKELEAGQ